MKERFISQQMITTYLCIIVAVMLLMLPLFFTSTQALPGNGGSNDPWITSSPVTYHISDSTPTGSSVSDDGLVLSMDMLTFRDGDIKNFANSKDGVVTGPTISSSINCVRDSSLGFNGNAVTTSLLTGQVVNITFGGWYKPNISPMYRGAVFATGDISDGFQWGFGDYTTSNHIYYLLPSSDGWQDTGFDFIANKWYCVFWTVSFESVGHVDVTCYVDNVEIYSLINHNPIVSTGLSRIISDGTNGFNGWVDECFMWTRSLSFVELSEQYNSTFTKYNIQTKSHYSYQAIQNQTSVYPAWSIDSNAPNVTIDSVGKVMGYWESWENGTYWINVTVQNVNGYAWQNYSVVVVEGTIITTFILTDEIIFALIFLIISVCISMVGYKTEIKLLPVIALIIALAVVVTMFTLFTGWMVYLVLLFLLVLGIIPLATWRK